MVTLYVLWAYNTSNNRIIRLYHPTVYVFMSVLYKRDDVSERASTHERTHPRTMPHSFFFPPVSIAAALRRERWLALVCMSPHSWACLLVAPGRKRGEERTLFRKQANFRLQRISSLNEGGSRKAKQVRI